jgi:hypothetical protein
MGIGAVPWSALPAVTVDYNLGAAHSRIRRERSRDTPHPDGAFPQPL